MNPERVLSLVILGCIALILVWAVLRIVGA